MFDANFEDESSFGFVQSDGPLAFAGEVDSPMNLDVSSENTLPMGNFATHADPVELEHYLKSHKAASAKDANVNHSGENLEDAGGPVRNLENPSPGDAASLQERVGIAHVKAQSTMVVHRKDRVKIQVTSLTGRSLCRWQQC